MLAGDLKAEADWDLTVLMGGPDISSRASTCDDCGRVCEACLGVIESASPSVADLMSLAVRTMEVMSRESVLEVCVGALESTILSSNTYMEEPESQHESKNLECNRAARRARFNQASSLLCQRCL